MPHAIVKIPSLALLAVLLLAACAASAPEGAGEEGMTRIAEKLQAQGDDAGAADFYQRALQRHPDDRGALRNLAAILEAHGNFAAAETYYARGLKLAPKDRDLQHAEGRVLIRLGKAAKARDLYRKILDRDGDDVKALNGLGIALDYLGQHEEAEQQYRAALEEEPENLGTLNNLAHSLVLAGKYDDAIGLLEPHAADKAATPALRQNLAEAYGLAGKTIDAERLARVDLKPQQVKRNLANYRARRARLVPEPEFAADLGSYPTAEVANAEAERIRAFIADSKIKIATEAEVLSIGGTPGFALHATGFASAAGLNDFCAKLAANGAGCKAAKNR